MVPVGKEAVLNVLSLCVLGRSSRADLKHQVPESIESTQERVSPLNVR